jgi:hypothetical protein
MTLVSKQASISDIQILSLWQPTALLRSVLAVQADPTTLPLAAILIGVTLSALLVAEGRGASYSSRTMRPLLGAIAAGTLALVSANVLTMLIGWIMYDAFSTIARIFSRTPNRGVISGLVVAFVSATLLWAGGICGGSGTDLGLWDLMEPATWQLPLWTMAAALRLGLYPLSTLNPVMKNRVDPVDVPDLMNSCIGWGLWLRILSITEGTAPQFTWLNILALVTLGMGSFLAWSSRSPSQAVAWLPLGGTGAILLASSLASRYAIAIVLTGSSAILLGTALIALGQGIRREAWWWSAPSVIGGCLLAMLPLSSGFMATAYLLDDVAQQNDIWWGLAFVMHEVFLIPSLIHLLQIPPYSLPSQRRAVGIWAAGLGILVLAALLTGFWPSLMVGAGQVPSWGDIVTLPGLTGWLLWLVAAGIGGVLAWQNRKVRGRLELLLSATHDLFRLDWLFNVIVGAVGRGIGVLKVTDETITGTGALFWSILLVLIVVLAQGM